MANGASSPGVWEAENLLDAVYDASGESAAYEPHTMSIEVRTRTRCESGGWVVVVLRELF